MIADDMMTFIKSDIIVFGIGVFYLLLELCGLCLKKINLDNSTYQQLFSL